MDGKIDPSWDIIEQEKIELADGKKGNECLVIFVNPAVADKAKGKLLFVCYSAGAFYSRKLYGQVVLKAVFLFCLPPCLGRS